MYSGVIHITRLANLGVEIAAGDLTLILITLSSTSKTISPPCRPEPDGRRSAEISLCCLLDEGVSGVVVEAFMKLIGVIRELGLRVLSSRGSSKYD